jgi:hypothetical protein
MPHSRAPTVCARTLPCLPRCAPVAQLRHLCSLTYEGPADRRQRGINIMHALETLTAAGDGTVLCQLQPPAAAAAAAAAAAGCKSRADGSSAGCSAGDAPPADCAALDDLPCSAGAPLGDGARSSSGECAAPAHQGQQPQQQPHALECLDLRGGRLPDGLMEVVGRLTGLTSLRLSATTPMNTAPLAALTNITCLHLTVRACVEGSAGAVGTRPCAPRPGLATP